MADDDLLNDEAKIRLLEHLVREEGEKFKAAMREHMPMLHKIASVDQSVVLAHPWNYTDRCYSCGGTKAFLDWLEERVK